MANSVLLDTNIVIALLRTEERTQQKLQLFDDIFIPAIVVGELLYGVHNARSPAREAAKVAAFLTSLDEAAILPCDHATAQVYGWLKTQRAKVGKPIPENDFWIAAIAVQFDLTLATRDSHFQDIATIKTDAF